MTKDYSTGKGCFKPADTTEYAEITVFVKDGVIQKADYNCSDDNTLKACVKAVCLVIADKPYLDVFQMNNNAVYYNLDIDLDRSKLFFATIAVMAAKKAVVDYCKKNEIELPPDSGLCSCIK